VVRDVTTVEVTLPMSPGDCEKQTPAEVNANVGVVANATGQAALLDLAVSTGTCMAKAGQESGMGKDNFVVSLAFMDTVAPAESASAVEDASAVIADGDFCVSLGVGGETKAVATLKKANVTQGMRTHIVSVADTSAAATCEVAALLGVALAIACLA
jgi:hypothetical protein